MSLDELRRKIRSGEIPPVVMTPPETDPTKPVTTWVPTGGGFMSRDEARAVLAEGVDYAIDDDGPFPDLTIEKR